MIGGGSPAATAFRLAFLAVAFFVCGVPGSLAQIIAPLSGPFELSGTVYLDEADSTTREHLERVKAYIGDAQWDEAVETLRQITESSGTKMIAVSPQRYVSLADYCHLQISALPAPALNLYRQRVDALAQKSYAQGVAERDAVKLEAVVRRLFCSSWGDDALLALGDLQLERGHFGAARDTWEKIIERPPQMLAASEFEAAAKHPSLTADQKQLLSRFYVQRPGEPRFYVLHNKGLLSDATARQLIAIVERTAAAPRILAYPATELALAQVRARLILVAILEGALDRARSDLDVFAQLHPQSEGILAGRKVKYLDGLKSLLSSAEKWPATSTTAEWPTFAGSTVRTQVVPYAVDPVRLAWKPWKIGEPLVADVANSRVFSRRRVGEDAQRLLSFHPVVVNDLILLCNDEQIFAFKLASGAAAWPRTAEYPPGLIYGEKDGSPTPGANGRGLGVPRFTLTVDRDRLYARLGSQVTTRPAESFEMRSNRLVRVDLAAKGPMLKWEIKPDDEKWAFEGAPVAEGQNVYVGMRKSDVRPQAHVACYDAETGRLRWRTLVCSAETPGGGQLEELTHNLLTLHHGVIYYNTNLGGVAALDARDGRTHWVSLYQRAKAAGTEDHAAHFYRDLNPAIYYQGTLIVAPADSPLIFALNATTGETLWRVRLTDETNRTDDPVHLLGIGNGNLLASGDRLWWIDAASGKLRARWPDGTPHGKGRGVLAGNSIYWPTHEAIYVLDQRISGKGPRMVRDPITFGENRASAAGNLLIAGDKLVIATADRLAVLHATRAAAEQPAEPEQVRGDVGGALRSASLEK